LRLAYDHWQDQPGIFLFKSDQRSVLTTSTLSSDPTRFLSQFIKAFVILFRSSAQLLLSATDVASMTSPPRRFIYQRSDSHCMQSHINGRNNQTGQFVLSCHLKLSPLSSSTSGCAISTLSLRATEFVPALLILEVFENNFFLPNLQFILTHVELLQHHCKKIQIFALQRSASGHLFLPRRAHSQLWTFS